MCRWIVYLGQESALLGDLISKPKNSLVQQSFAALWHPGFTSRNNAVLNADGFGVSWFHQGKPFCFKSVSPAWSDPNLAELKDCVSSTCIFGHVRAASPGSVVSHENCHPFKFGRLVFMHNGHIEGFSRIRRALVAQLSDEAFANIKGLTDSEHAFALLLTGIHDPGRRGAFAPDELERAIMVVVTKITTLLADAGIVEGFTSCNFALTDGETVVATRFCDKWPAIPPPSLYFCFTTLDILRAELDGSTGSGPGDGSKNVDTAVEGGGEAEDHWHGVDSDRWRKGEDFLASAEPLLGHGVVLVSSEPITVGTRVRWLPLPANAMLSFTTKDGNQTPPRLQHLYATLGEKSNGKSESKSKSKNKGTNMFPLEACQQAPMPDKNMTTRQVREKPAEERARRNNKRAKK